MWHYLQRLDFFSSLFHWVECFHMCRMCVCDENPDVFETIKWVINTDKFHYLEYAAAAAAAAKSLQSCPTLCDPMDSNPPGCSVHRILQARTLEWVAISFPIGIYYVHTKGFPGGSVGKESACNAGDTGLIPGLGRSSGEGNGNPLQHSCLENLTDRGAWRAVACGVSRVRRETSLVAQAVKVSTYNAGGLGSSPGSGRVRHGLVTKAPQYTQKPRKGLSEENLTCEVVLNDPSHCGAKS